MILLMGISLYTSRVVLQVLGVSDYGIYNVVGGFVSMFSIVSASLSAAISRFLTVELGKGDETQLSKIFSSSVTIQIGLAVIVFILAESIGLWYLNSKMNISADRMVAANWVFQLSLATFAVNLINIPYNSAIVAHEKMGAFAYIGIFDGIAKLVIAFLLFQSPFDSLIYYALLMFAVSLIIRLLYTFYCKRNFTECKYHFYFDKDLLKEMFGFAGWNMIGATAGILRDQGGNVVLNYFLGTAINAARGVSFQVKNAVQSFSTNFMMALNPQITKSYARGDRDYMMSLVFRGARFSYFILLVLSLPIIISAPYLLDLWLVEVPEHSISFVRLVLLFSMSEALSIPLITAMLATGDIRDYQIIVGGLNLLNLPIFIVLLILKVEPESIFITEIVMSQACLAARLILLKKMLGLKVRKYLKEVYLNVIIVTLLSSILPILLYFILKVNFCSFCIVSVVSVLSVGAVVWFIGFTERERAVFANKIISVLNKKITSCR